MSLVTWEKDETVAILYMNDGENRHNPTFGKAMLAVLDEIEADKEIKSLIVTSSDPKNFSQGVDLQFVMTRMQEKDDAGIKEMMYVMGDVFKRLLLFPVPVIAAINGHAFGNGAMLACSCDFRFMRADRGYFCFPEVDVNIQFTPGMIAWVKKAIPYYLFQELKYTGRRATAAELEEHHVIQKASENVEELMKDSIAFAKTFQKSRKTFREMKKRMHKHIIETIDTEDKEMIEVLFLMTMGEEEE
ncbi:MAG: enoyl-CoA hydratase/isomerase family protein [bacterium]|nr:enoyl-CoA hydratase/isomerase family protein [bacterium]